MLKLRLSLLFLLFSFLFLTPEVCRSLDQSDLERWLNRIDSRYDSQELMAVVREFPEKLEPVLLSHSNSIQTKSSALGFWCVLAAEGKISIERFFDVAVSSLALLSGHLPISERDGEQRYYVYVLSSFGSKPRRVTPIYKGVQSSMSFFLICVKAMAKQKMIKSGDALQKILSEGSAIQALFELGTEKEKWEGVKRLGALIGYSEREPAIFSSASFSLFREFARNITLQLKPAK